MPYIEGTVDHVIYSTDNHYFVLSLDVHETDSLVRQKNVKVSGHLCGIKYLRQGIRIRIAGEWINHPKFGRQMVPSTWTPWGLSNPDRVRFLNECIEGFEDYALTVNLVEVFGEQIYEALSDPARCHAVLDSGDGRHGILDAMTLQWRKARTLCELSSFLHSYELGPETVKDIYRRFGHDAIEIISKNPYRLTAVENFPFERADRIALRSGIAREDTRRLEGAVLWILRLEAQQGHLFVRRGDLPDRLNEHVRSKHVDPFNVEDLYSAMQNAVRQLEAHGDVTIDESVGVYLPEFFMYERGGAEKLARFLTASDIELDLETFLTEYQKGNQIDLSEAQRDAVRKLLEHRVVVVTGTPGTGKTTIIRALVMLFKRVRTTFALTAPTGIAAKRLAAVTGEDAMTIHRTFGFNGIGWGLCASNKFNIGAVIVDEMSMVDQELFFRILDALYPSTMIVLVGDDAQLPSVGPGNVLRELLGCPQIPNVRLTQIFRQAQTSSIVLASHRINKGQTPLAPLVDTRDKDSEFQFAECEDEERIVKFIVEAAFRLKARDANFQVLSPKYDGVVGVTELNERLRDRLNPDLGQHEWKSGKLHIRVGDRLMVVKNDYELNIYNGDMCKFVGIERHHLIVKVHGFGPGSIDAYVNIPKERAPVMLRLAYAITVHKSQGSEFDTILMPIVCSQGRMLQRNLFYTAVTRARKKVWLLGESAAVIRAITNDKVLQRNTVFSRIVQECYAALASVDPGHGRAREENPLRAVNGGSKGEASKALVRDHP